MQAANAVRARSSQHGIAGDRNSQPDTSGGSDPQREQVANDRQLQDGSALARSSQPTMGRSQRLQASPAPATSQQSMATAGKFPI